MSDSEREYFNLFFFLRYYCAWDFVFSWYSADCSSGWLEGPNKVYIPFLACGDLTGYDSDRSYPLPREADGSSYQSLDPIQPPIAPPYKRALELKKASAQSFNSWRRWYQKEKGTNFSLDSV